MIKGPEKRKMFSIFPSQFVGVHNSMFNMFYCSRTYLHVWCTHSVTTYTLTPQSNWYLKENF